MSLIAEVYNQLLERGFEVNLLEAFSCISHKSSYQTTIQLWVDDEDEEAWNGAKIASNGIEIDNSLSLGRKLLICNHFNKQMHYCSAYLSDDENELFMVSACVPIGCENFVEVCADMFEEVINATEYLVELIGGE